MKFTVKGKVLVPVLAGLIAAVGIGVTYGISAAIMMVTFYLSGIFTGILIRDEDYADF